MRFKYTSLHKRTLQDTTTHYIHRKFHVFKTHKEITVKKIRKQQIIKQKSKYQFKSRHYKSRHYMTFPMYIEQEQDIPLKYTLEQNIISQNNKGQNSKAYFTNFSA